MNGPPEDRQRTPILVIGEWMASSITFKDMISTKSIFLTLKDTFIVKSLKTVSSEFWNEVIERDAYAVSYQV